MKLIEGAYQTSDDLIIVNAAYPWHVSFWRKLFTVICGAKHAHYFLDVDDRVGEIIQMEMHGSYRNGRCSKHETLA